MKYATREQTFSHNQCVKDIEAYNIVSVNERNKAFTGTNEILLRKRFNASASLFAVREVNINTFVL